MKLRSLGLPKTTGTLYSPVNNTRISGYNNGTAITEIYYRDSNKGYDSGYIMREISAYLPAAQATPTENDLIDIVVDDTTLSFEVVVVQKKFHSHFENHYKLILRESNTDDDNNLG